MSASRKSDRKKVLETPAPFKVLIVGASIAGLTLAVCLEKAGIDYTLLEGRQQIGQSNDSEEEVPCICNLPPTGVSLLDQLGLWKGDRGVERLSVRHSTTLHFGFNGRYLCGMQTSTVAEKQCGYPLAFVEKKNLLRGLLHGLDSSESKIILGKQVISLEESESGVKVKTSDGAEYEGDIVVGADGPDGIVGMSLGEGNEKLEAFLSPQYLALWGTCPSDDPATRTGTMMASHFNGHVGTIILGPRDDIFWWNMVSRCPEDQSHDDPLMDAEAIGQTYRDCVLSEALSFGQLWDSKVQSQLVREEEGIRSVWSKGRVVLAGDAVHKVPLNRLFGAGLSIEGSVALADAIYTAIYQNKPRRTDVNILGSRNPDKFCLDSITEMFTEYHDAHHPRAETYLKAHRMFMQAYVDMTAPISGHAPLTILWKATSISPRFLHCKVKECEKLPRPREKRGIWEYLLAATALGSIGALAIVALRRWRGNPGTI